MIEPFRVAVALRNGVTPATIRSPELSAPFHGVRSAHGVENDIVALCRAYAAKMRRDAAFTHFTAAQLWGAPLPVRVHPSPLHVSAPPDTAPVRGRGVLGHHHSAATSISQLGDFRVLSPASTWVSLGPTLSMPDLVAVGDFFVTPAGSGPALCEVEDLSESLSSGLRPRGAVRLRRALDFIRPGSASRPESLMRVLLVGSGFPEPRLNHRIVDLGAFVDLAWPDFRFGIEYDGGYHRDSRQFGADIRRHELIHDRRWLLMRVTKDDLFDAPLELVARARARLAGRGCVVPGREISQDVTPRR